MKIYVNLLLFTTHVTESFRDTLRRLKELGADGVEVPLFQGSTDHYQKIGHMVREEGLEVSAVATVNTDNDPSALEEKIRRAGIEFLEQRVDWTNALGATTLCGPLALPWGQRPKGLVGQALVAHIRERLSKSAQSLREVAIYAQGLGVQVCNEYLVGYELPGCNRIGDATALAEAVNEAGFGVLIDTSHETTYGRGPAAFKSAVKKIAEAKRPIWFHASKTGDRGDFTQSWIDFNDILFTLKWHAGWEGPVVIEIFDAEEPFASGVGINDPPFADKFAVAEKCMQFIRKEWARVPILAEKFLEEMAPALKEVTPVPSSPHISEEVSG